MKAKLGCLTLCATVAVASCASAKDLPDACGDDATHFHVATQPGRPLSDPSPGHALVVFIESVDQGFCLGCNPITTRTAIDGAWIGANNNHSYLVSEVLPGHHQLCADWQQLVDLKVHVISFNAVAGKTYFFLVRVTNNAIRTGQAEQAERKIRIYPLGDAEGPSLLRDANLSVASVYK